MGDVTRMDDVVSVAIWGIGGTPPPNFFLSKNAIFHIFHQNSNSLDYTKLGVGTPSPRGATPLKFFLTF